MSAIRNKTVRRSVSFAQDISANLLDFNVNESLQRLIAAEADNAYKKPWHRLERGLRLNRLRAFSEDLGAQRGLKPTEKQALLTLLTKALDKKQLNSKTAVDYDPDEEKIKEIKSLVMHQNAAGEVLFQLLEKRNAVTFRKRAGAGTGAPTAAQGGPAQREADASPGGEEA
jgi:hypothetical protein